ncbi:MFS transporter, partial [Staphylococcus shinii]
FILSFFVTSFAEQFSVFMVGMIILTLGEMFVWPAVPTIANQLAPNGKEGSFQGYVNSAATVGKAFGPLIGGVVVDTFNMQAMFLSMIFLLVIALIFLMIYDRKLSKEI